MHLHFNLLAILGSGALLWVLGAIWYSPVLFAKPWAAMVPTPADRKKSMMAGMVMSFIGDILLAFVLAHVIVWSGAVTFQRGAFIGLVMWMGFFAAPGIPQGIFESRPFKLFAINTGYMLIGLVVIGGVLAIWR